MDKIKLEGQMLTLHKSNPKNAPAKGVLAQSQFTGHSLDGAVRARYITGPTALKGGAKKTLCTIQFEEDTVDGTVAAVDRQTITVTLTGGDTPQAQKTLVDRCLAFFASLSAKNGAELRYRVELDASDPLVIDTTLLDGVIAAMSDVTP